MFNNRPVRKLKYGDVIQDFNQMVRVTSVTKAESDKVEMLNLLGDGQTIRKTTRRVNYVRVEGVPVDELRDILFEPNHIPATYSRIFQEDEQVRLFGHITDAQVHSKDHDMLRRPGA